MVSAQKVLWGRSEEEMGSPKPLVTGCSLSRYNPFYLLNGVIPDFFRAGVLENLKASGDVNKSEKSPSYKDVVSEGPRFFFVLQLQLS